VLKKYGLPVSDDMPVEQIVEATAMDKKGSGKNIKLILLDQIGNSSIFEMERSNLLDFANGSLS
jgi:3-dehydroquinate synthase